MTPSDIHADSCRVLIVDDDRDTVESMALVLRHFGYAVETATDGNDAIETARQQRPTHVLLDLAMPRMDGYQFAARLRRESPEPFLLIAISGHGQTEDRQRTRLAGFDHHLIKPADLEDLLSLLSGEESGTWVRQSEPRADPDPRADMGTVDSASPGNEPGESPIAEDLPPQAEPSPEAMRDHKPPKQSVNRQLEITNALGLHLRAASKLVQLAQQFRSEVWVACDGRKVNGRSLLDVMTLGAACGAWIELEADGPDAEAALDALIGLIGCGFDEPRE